RDKGTLSGTDAVWYQQANNVIFDHCSFSHGQDECMDISYSQGVSGDVTVQNCIFADSKTGVLLGIDSSNESTELPDLGDFTFINNVFANISHRFPNPQGNGHYDIINNIVYNWKERLIRTTQEGTYNVINNYYKTSNQGLRRNGWYPGSNNLSVRLHKMQIQLGETPLVYASGSVITGQRMEPQDDDSDMFQYFTGSHSSYPQNNQVSSQFFTNQQFPLAGKSFEIKSAHQTYTDVLNDVGANKYLNADGTFGFYQDTKDAADISMIQNDSWVSYSSNDFTYTPVNLVPYPIVPSNSRPSNFYVSNPHIPEIW